jgi:hypothetical protein
MVSFKYHHNIKIGKIRRYMLFYMEATEKPALTKTPQFTAATLKTRNYRFNREQANER